MAQAESSRQIPMPEVLHSDRSRRAAVLERGRAQLDSHRDSIELLVLFLLAGWLAFSWFETVHRILRYYDPLPVWDYWRTAVFVDDYRAFHIGALWRQHNEHRIVFPEIVFAADYLLLHGRQLLPLALSFLCYFANWLVLVWAFWPASGVSPFIRKAGILLAGIIIGWQGSAAALASAFLLQWTLLQLAVLLSLAFLSRLKETAKSGYLWGVIACAVIATYSSGNGMLLWPILVAAGFLFSLNRRQMAILTAAAILSIGAYFIGYEFKGKLVVSNFLLHPIYSIDFIGSYFSMPFGGMKSPQFGANVGLVSLCITAFLAIFAARLRLLGSRTGIVLFGWYLFTLLTCLLTAAGRMIPSDPLFSAAKPARYVTVPLVTWAAFILLCLWLSSRFKWNVASPRVIAFVIAVLLLIGLPKLRWWLRDKDYTYTDQQAASLSMDDGLTDPSVMLHIFPDTVSVKKWLAPLRRYRLSIFYKGHGKWLGRPASQFAVPLTTPVSGEITYTFPVLGGVEVAGWADESQLRGRTDWILLVNEHGQIAGFGRKLPAGFPGALHAPHTPASLGWVGFVNLQIATKSVSAWVVNKGGLLPIEGSTMLPSMHAASASDAGAGIAGIGWQMDPSWTVNQLPPRVPFGTGPAGPVYGSWSGADQNTGEIRSSIFAAPENGCLILPVLQGPRAAGLLAEVVDADTEQVIGSAPLEDDRQQWSFWRVAIPATAKRVQIIARDEGRDWGEWLAIGQPSQCR